MIRGVRRIARNECKERTSRCSESRWIDAPHHARRTIFGCACTLSRNSYTDRAEAAFHVCCCTRWAKVLLGGDDGAGTGSSSDSDSPDDDDADSWRTRRHLLEARKMPPDKEARAMVAAGPPLLHPQCVSVFFCYYYSQAPKLWASNVQPSRSKVRSLVCCCVVPSRWCAAAMRCTSALRATSFKSFARQAAVMATRRFAG